MKKLFLTDRFFFVSIFLIFLFILSYGFSFLFIIAKLLTFLFLGLIIIDIVILFSKKGGILGKRVSPPKFSNGDDNKIELHIQTNYSFNTRLLILDELPAILQIRDTQWEKEAKAQEEIKFSYSLRPTKRGVYAFGALNIIVESPIRLIRKKYQFDVAQDVSVYPSFLKMRNQELIAFSRKNTNQGNKRMRRIGQAMEFEQIKEYVAGDDPRMINWKATAKSGDLMLNQYIDERAQQIFCIVDKGRLMKLPFNGLSLLDYAINATIAISNIALKNEDKVGLVTFESKLGAVLPARNKRGYLLSFMKILHKQKTNYKESNFELLYNYVSRKINQRSLLILFTNFESMSSLKRQLPYIKSLARKHLLLVVFYKNTELFDIAIKPADTVQDIYNQTIAEQFILEKQRIVKELKRYGVLSLLTEPQSLSVDVINAYLSIKERRML